MSPSTSNARMANMRSGRGKMLLIAALCIAPVVASYLAYYVWQPQGRVNYGDLVAVRQLPDAPLPHLDGKPFRLSDLRGKWVMLSIDSGECAAACETKRF